MKRPLVTGLLLLALASTALAATPESGTVSKDSPSVRWEGKAAGYGVIIAHLAMETAGQSPTCEAPACDSFALKVADKADLDVVATTRSGSGIEMHVVKPDGEVVVARIADQDTIKIRVKGAAPGDYTVEVLTNDSAEEAAEYDASATLNVPPPAAPTGPAPAPAPAPSSGEPAATIGLATKSVSARKRSFKLALTSSKPVTGVKVALRKGKKVLAKGALASLNGRGTVTLKPKKRLKPGTYQVVASAADGSRTVGVTTKLKVKK